MTKESAAKIIQRIAWDPSCFASRSDAEIALIRQGFMFALDLAYARLRERPKKEADYYYGGETNTEPGVAR